MQKKSFKQKCLAWILSLAVAVTFIPMSAGIAFADDEATPEEATTVAAQSDEVTAKSDPVDISGYYVKLSVTSVVYDGKEHKPTAELYTVKNGIKIESTCYDVTYPDATHDAYKKTGTFPVLVTANGTADVSGTTYTGSVKATFTITDEISNVKVFKQSGINGDKGSYIKEFGMSHIKTDAGAFTTSISTLQGDTSSYVPVELLLSEAGVSVVNDKDVLQYWTYSEPEKYFGYWSFGTLKEYDGFYTGSGSVLAAFGKEYSVPAFLMLDQVGKSPRGGAGWKTGQAGKMFPNSVSQIVYVSMNIANLAKGTASDVVYDGTAVKPAATVMDGSTKVDVDVTTAAKNVGPATATVTAKDSSDYYGTQTVSYKILPKTTTLKSVSKGKKKIIVEWAAQKTLTSGYQIRYSKKANLSNAKYKTINKTRTTKKTIYKLSKKTKYYVQVRTFKTVRGTKYYSAWSNTKAAKTK